MAVDLSILSGLLGLAGSGAQGYMQGHQQAVAMQQMRQVMALREAEEMRAQALHPVRLAGARQEQDQARQSFPLMQESRGLANTAAAQMNLGRAQQLDPIGEMLGGSLESVFGKNESGQPNFPVDPRAPFGQKMEIATLFGQGQRAAEATKRKGLLTGGEAQKQEKDLLRLYYDTVKLGTPREMFDYVLAADPQMANALQSAGATQDRNAFAQALRAQIKARYGYDVGQSSANPGPSYLQGLPAPVINFQR